MTIEFGGGNDASMECFASTAVEDAVGIVQEVEAGVERSPCQTAEDSLLLLRRLYSPQT